MGCVSPIPPHISMVENIIVIFMKMFMFHYKFYVPFTTIVQFNCAEWDGIEPSSKDFQSSALTTSATTPINLFLTSVLPYSKKTKKTLDAYVHPFTTVNDVTFFNVLNFIKSTKNYSRN